MAIADLMSVLPPPTAPREAAPADWAAVEAALGTSLPADYRAYVEAYGSGKVGDFIWIFNPFSVRDNITLQVQVERQLSVLKELAEGGEVMPYPLFPAPGGLLPMGMTDNGDVLHWRTDGAPDEWTIVVNDARSPDCAAHAEDLTRFLARVLTRAETCSMFPEDFPPEAPAFEPK